MQRNGTSQSETLTAFGNHAETMGPAASLRGGDMRVFRLLEDAANAGAICPSNDVIAGVLGCLSSSQSTACLRKLEASKLIEVQRFAGSRVVTIKATGQQTYLPPHYSRQTHWRHDKDRDPSAPPKYPRRYKKRMFAVGPRKDIPKADMVEALRVNREPCFYCGTRADVGCSHQ